MNVWIEHPIYSILQISLKYLGKDFLEKMGLVPFLMSFCSARKVFRRLAKLHEKMGPQPAIACSKSTMETPEQYLIKVNNKDIRTNISRN